MRIFKTRAFQRWMKKSGLADKNLCAAADEMKRGLVEADLGGGVFKKRVALPGMGKSGGARTIVATNRCDRWFFLFGYEKNDIENISNENLRYMQALAKRLLKMSEEILTVAVSEQELEEIFYERE